MNFDKWSYEDRKLKSKITKYYYYPLIDINFIKISDGHCIEEESNSQVMFGTDKGIIHWNSKSFYNSSKLISSVISPVINCKKILPIFNGR